MFIVANQSSLKIACAGVGEPAALRPAPEEGAPGTGAAAQVVERGAPLATGQARWLLHSGGGGGGFSRGGGGFSGGRCCSCGAGSSRCTSRISSSSRCIRSGGGFLRLGESGGLRPAGQGAPGTGASADPAVEQAQVAAGGVVTFLSVLSTLSVPGPISRLVVAATTISILRPADQGAPGAGPPAGPAVEQAQVAAGGVISFTLSISCSISIVTITTIAITAIFSVPAVTPRPAPEERARGTVPGALRPPEEADLPAGGVRRLADLRHRPLPGLLHQVGGVLRLELPQGVEGRVQVAT